MVCLANKNQSMINQSVSPRSLSLAKGEVDQVMYLELDRPGPGWADEVQVVWVDGGSMEHIWSAWS